MFFFYNTKLIYQIKLVIALQLPSQISHMLLEIQCMQALLCMMAIVCFIQHWLFKISHYNYYGNHIVYVQTGGQSLNHRLYQWFASHNFAKTLLQLVDLAFEVKSGYSSGGRALCFKGLNPPARRIEPIWWMHLQFGLFSIAISGPQLVDQRLMGVLSCL